MAPRLFRFDDFELHPDQSSLLHKGRKLKLQPQPLRVLALLIARSPSLVTKEELAEHIWGDGVHVDLDQSLNYCIRQIRQVLDDSATLPRYVETLPRQGYRFICPVIAVPGPETQREASLQRPPAGPPFADETSVAQDPGESPSLANSTPGRAEPVPPSGRLYRRKIAAPLLAASLLVIFGVMAHRSYVRTSALSPHLESLAVLPLENLSGDPGQDYLADGMTEELTTMLARDSTLRVISRTSAMQYKGAHRPLPEIARALGADAVIEGSLAREGTRMHITVQLIRADTDSHLWAESYDRDANDATASDLVARSIAARLNRAAPSLAAVRAIAPAAHEAYLHGRYLWPTSRMEESGAYFRKATEIQPDYAEAWAGLANFYGEGIAGGLLDPRINMRLEEEAAKRALALAPGLAVAHQAISAAYLIDHWHGKSADREVLQAISLDPSDAESLYLRANVLDAVGRFPEAIEVEKKSVEMAPFERPDALASIYIEARMYDEALADIQLRMETVPNDSNLLWTAGDVRRSKGNYKEATELWATSRIAAGDPAAAVAMRRAYQLGGPRGLIRWNLEQRLTEAKSRYVSPVQLASYYAQLGDKEHTLTLLEEGFQQHSTDMLWITDDPAYDFLHADGRYQALVQSVARSLAM